MVALTIGIRTGSYSLQSEGVGEFPDPTPGLINVANYRTLVVQTLNPEPSLHLIHAPSLVQPYSLCNHLSKLPFSTA